MYFKFISLNRQYVSAIQDHLQVEHHINLLKLTDWWIAAGPRQHSDFWFRVPRDSRRYFTDFFLKTEFFLNNTYRISSYLTENTLRLRYKAQQVNAVWGKSRCLLWESYEHTDTLCGQTAEFKYVKAGGAYSNHWALKS
jgi:hypothetical protein